MEKEIIVLAKSWKRSGYCIAGIDTETGNWVRIITDDASIQHAVTEEDMRYENGTCPHVYDVVRIECIGHTPNHYQPENYTMDKSYFWRRVGQVNINDVIDIHPAEILAPLLYNYDKKVTPEELLQLGAAPRYSLALIRPSNVVITVKRWDGNPRPKVTASFRYLGQNYRFVKITDPDFARGYENCEDDDYPIDNVYFVISLADPNPDDGNHWKLVATVLEDEGA